MDDAKKKKTLLTVLAVLALGAGSYYMFFSDSDRNVDTSGKSGPVQRKEGKKKEETTVEKKKVTKAPTKEVEAVKRKEREDSADSTVERKAKRKEKTEEKKRLAKPAA